MQRSSATMLPEPDLSTLTYGPLTLDLDGFAVSVRGRDVPVTLSEFLLLSAFSRNPYRVLDRAALLEALRGATAIEGRESVDLRLVDRHISRLRKKLKDAGCDCIRTMRFAGYRFIPPPTTGRGDR